MDKTTERVSIASRATYLGLIVNILLVVVKLGAGIFGRSGAIMADAIHSLSDSVTDIFVLIGLRISSKPPDKSHDYGHGKIETLCALLIGVVLAVVGAKILWDGIHKVFHILQGQPIPKPEWIAVFAAIMSIIAKEWIYRHTIRIGKRIDSQVVIANAWHHRTDALSSVGVMLGIGGSIIIGGKWIILDPIAAALVSIFIISMAVSIAKSSIGELLEASLCEKTEREITQIASSIDGVINPHELRTRKIGSNVAIDLHIEVKKEITIVKAHDISTNVENALKKRFNYRAFISIHIEPAENN